MNRVRFMCCLVLLGACGALTPAYGSVPRAGQEVQKERLYKFRNGLGRALYKTGSTLPAGLSDGPWKNMGPVCIVGRGAAPGWKPIYQLVQGDVYGVRYAYTTDPSQVEFAPGRNSDDNTGWTNQGVAFYVANTQLPGTAPLYGLWRITILHAYGPPVSGTGSYLFTTDPNLSDLKNWVKKGVIGYVWPQGSEGAQPASFPDLTIVRTFVKDSGIEALIRNQGEVSVSSSPGVYVALNVYDQSGKLVHFSGGKQLGGMSAGQQRPFLFNTGTLNLDNTTYQVQVDPANLVQESDENNNKTARLDGPRRNITIKNLDPERVIPPSIDMTGKEESGTKDKPRAIYAFTVTNWNTYPVEWFQTSTSLPPAPCGSETTNARMLLHIVAEAGGKPMKAGCKVLNSPQDLKSIQTLPTGGALPKPDKVFVVLENRLANKKYQSNSYPVEVFGVGKDLFTLGCKRLLGRPDDFVCTKKLGFDACMNLKANGKPITCRLAGQ